MISMEKARKEFPALRNQNYVNTPVYGPLYDSLLDWRQEHDLDFLLKASDMRDKSLKIISDTRTTVGEFFKCKRENVALINNFSTGMNMFLEGLDNKQKVLLLENDYPSVDWPFASRDFPITYVEMDANLEDRILEAVKKENISILALSVVQWQNGIRIDFGFLDELKKEYPDLLIIGDGTQFLGNTNFDFEASPFDVLGASGYKWLLAGYGNGFMLFKDWVKERCALKTIGFNAANARPELKNEVRFARRFEPGHLSCLNFGSLKFSLDFLSEVGMDNIERHNLELAEKAKHEFTQLGLLQEAVVERKIHSTIFNIKANDALFRLFVDHDVICAQRGDGIRVGFHFYNTEENINAIVRILKKTRQPLS